MLIDGWQNTCEVFKSIRKQIVEVNGIPYTPAECCFEGECAGTGQSKIQQKTIGGKGEVDARPINRKGGKAR